MRSPSTRTPVSLKELSLATGLHPSTAHRILNDMVACRFVDRSDPGSYRLGMRLLELGNLVKARLSVRDAALAPMRALHRVTGQTVNLSVRQGDEIVYIERAYSERSGMQVVRAIGGRAPAAPDLGRQAVPGCRRGRARAQLCHAHQARPGHTGTSITDIAKLERELSWVRTNGYARDNEELELGVRCIAAGIYDDSRRLVAGLSLSAPADRLLGQLAAEPQGHRAADLARHEATWRTPLWRSGLIAPEHASRPAHSPLKRNAPTGCPRRVFNWRRLTWIRCRVPRCEARIACAACGASGPCVRFWGGRERPLRALHRRLVLKPRAHARGIGKGATACPRSRGTTITTLPVVHAGLHHQALAGFRDETGLLQADLPVAAAHEAVGAHVMERTAQHVHFMLGLGREFADGRVAVSGVDQAGQVHRARHIAARSRPLESTKWLSFMPSSRALRFIALTNAGRPPG